VPPNLTLQVASPAAEAMVDEEPSLTVEPSPPLEAMEAPPAVTQYPSLDGTPPPEIPPQYAPLSPNSSSTSESVATNAIPRSSGGQDAKPLADQRTVISDSTSVGHGEESKSQQESTKVAAARQPAAADGSVGDGPQNVIGRVMARTPYPSTGHLPPLADAEPVRHRVVDGDSLEALAERYLGSRQRAGEIFAANQSLLVEPELLPIGIELIIPRQLRGPAPSQSADDPGQNFHAGSQADGA
jgi:nucleoid-associated protein YgaU